MYNIYTNTCYVLNFDGSLIECDCTQMPSKRTRKYEMMDSNDLSYATSIASVIIHDINGFSSVDMVLFSGLSNGQIGLVTPSSLHMFPVQAHVGGSRGLLASGHV